MTLLGFAKLEFLLRPRNLLRRLRPRNLLRRLRYRNTAAFPERMEVQVLGRPFALNPNEVVGRHILHNELIDLGF